VAGAAPSASPERAILHVDMDAFFASVEALEHPELRNKPLIVGGDGARGVVASCSYEARFYGVRSAMPSSKAKRLCPHAVFVSGSYGLYETYSKRMHDIFKDFTPLIEGISLDEAFLDVTGAQRLFGSGEQIGQRIRERVRDELGLTVSVGVATTKHVAKLASEAAKPKASRQGPIPGPGVFVVTEADAVPFLHGLPVRALWGVGPAAAQRLESIGVQTVRQLANMAPSVIASVLGKASAQHLHDLAWNRDDRDVVVERAAKSIGHEQTYPRDLYDRAALHDQLVRLIDAVTVRMRADQVVGRTVQLKVRFATFRTITRSRSLPKPTANSSAILKIADDLLNAIDIAEGVRLLGVSMSNLEDAAFTEQLQFLDGRPVSTDLDDAIDLIRQRFGDGSVVPAPLVGSTSPGRFQRGERQWGPNAP
jgi:DNA polymerase-4